MTEPFGIGSIQYGDRTDCSICGKIVRFGPPKSSLQIDVHRRCYSVELDISRRWIAEWHRERPNEHSGSEYDNWRRAQRAEVAIINGLKALTGLMRASASMMPTVQ